MLHSGVLGVCAPPLAAEELTRATEPKPHLHGSVAGNVHLYSNRTSVTITLVHDTARFLLTVLGANVLRPVAEVYVFERVQSFPMLKTEGMCVRSWATVVNAIPKVVL